MTYEGARLRVLKYIRKGLAGYRRKHLKSERFTIISNNCWGGMIYESYGLPKQSPTVGLFFFAEDYIRFLKHLKESLTAPLEFIRPEESHWKNQAQLREDKRFGKYPIGRLKNQGGVIEIFFLHYNSEAEARVKWERRCKRVDYDHILVKFNDQNGMQQKDLDTFLQFPYHKIFFTCRKWEHMDENCFLISQPSIYQSVTASHEPFGKSGYVDITEKINELFS